MEQPMQQPTERAHRKGHRERRVPAAESTTIDQLPWDQPVRRFAPMEIVDADQLETIHQASLEVLEDIGMEILLPEACQILGKAGALVDGERVRIGRDIIEAAIGLAPESFTFHARNPARNIVVGGSHIMFTTVGGPPNCSDLEGGRRPGSFADSQNFMRLAQVFNCIHVSGAGAVDSLDVHPSIRHLVIGQAKHKISDKVGFASSTSHARLFDGIEMTRIVRGVSRERLLTEPSIMTVVNTNSPLKLDGPMAMGIVEMARMGQVCCVTPFTLAGAMAPVTMAGALVEQNAEALSGLALSQLARPGAPFIYGGFTSNVDMKSGAPAFGTPEYMQACIVGGQLARRYRLPYRTSSTNAANCVDAQAAWESVFSLWGAIMGGGNLVAHAAGWLEGGLVASFEKFAADIDLLQTVAVFLKPMDTGRDALGIEAMREVGPGGHFFGAAHTLARYANAFYAPLVSDWRTYQQWQADGARHADQRANAVWKRALASYQQPAMDPAIAEELDSFVARRIAEGGQVTDFN
jgi:trimethylamine--corrinoid protein Co-methyltransferase